MIGGGVAGGLVGGPVGAVAGGIAGGAALDGITTGVDSAVHNEYRPLGQVAAVTNMVNGNASVGDVFDSVAGLVFDGATGYRAGKAAIISRDTGRNVQFDRVAGQKEVNKAKQASKIHVDSLKYKTPSFKPKLNGSAKKKKEETANQWRSQGRAYVGQARPNFVSDRPKIREKYGTSY